MAQIIDIQTRRPNWKMIVLYVGIIAASGGYLAGKAVGVTVGARQQQEATLKAAEAKEMAEAALKAEVKPYVPFEYVPFDEGPSDEEFLAPYLNRNKVRNTEFDEFLAPYRREAEGR